MLQLTSHIFKAFDLICMHASSTFVGCLYIFFTHQNPPQPLTFFLLPVTLVSSFLPFYREKKELQKILDRRRQNSIIEAKSRDKDKAKV